MFFLKKKFLVFVIFVLLLAIIVRSFFLEAFRIPTSSMQNTLMAGDYIIVSKAAYNISTPENLPFVEARVKALTIWNHSKPQRDDIIVFKFPGMPDELEPKQQVYYIKRIIGLPGDTVKISDKRVFINKTRVGFPLEANIDSIDDIRKNPNTRIFPPGAKWNTDNYGPIAVPKRGDIIFLNAYNVLQWAALINREHGKKVVDKEGSVITIEGKPVRTYTIRKNYYFVMGDNRDDSLDSRFWGFVPEESIVGKAIWVYWNSGVSLLDIFSAVKSNRILKSVK